MKKPITPSNEAEGVGRILADQNPPLTISQRALASQTQAIEINGVTYKIKSEVTLPVLRQNNNVVAFTVLEPIYIGRELKAQKDKAAMEPATLVKVIDLDDNRKKLYVVNAVLKSEWTENPEYNQVDNPDKYYVGKSFAVRKLPREEGKRHRGLEVLELEGIEPGDTVNAKSTIEEATE